MGALRIDPEVQQDPHETLLHILGSLPDRVIDVISMETATATRCAAKDCDREGPARLEKAHPVIIVSLKVTRQKLAFRVQGLHE
jgi:hypothetical protein